MLDILSDLSPFFEDCYRRIGVREYAGIAGLSPPTSSKKLSSYKALGLLKQENYRNYMLFFANKESQDFIDLSRMYWRTRLMQVAVKIEGALPSPAIVLFGSLSKAEAKKDSDIDLAVFSSGKLPDLKPMERPLKRGIQAFLFKSLAEIKNKELASNIANGYVLRGRLEV